MGYYSFVVRAAQPTGLIDPVVALDTGVNVFSVYVKDLEEFTKKLEDEGVEVREYHNLDEHSEVSLNDLLLPTESPNSLPGFSNEEEP